MIIAWKRGSALEEWRASFGFGSSSRSGSTLTMSRRGAHESVHGEHKHKSIALFYLGAASYRTRCGRSIQSDPPFIGHSKLAKISKQTSPRFQALEMQDFCKSLQQIISTSNAQLLGAPLLAGTRSKTLFCLFLSCNTEYFSSSLSRHYLAYCYHLQCVSSVAFLKRSHHSSDCTSIDSFLIRHCFRGIILKRS